MGLQALGKKVLELFCIIESCEAVGPGKVHVALADVSCFSLDVTGLAQQQPRREVYHRQAHRS